CLGEDHRGVILRGNTLLRLTIIRPFVLDANYAEWFFVRRHPMSRTRATEALITECMKKLGAVSCTFYVEDPWWPGELRLIFMPGVKFREPMQGFLIPSRSKTAVTEGKGIRLF